MKNLTMKITLTLCLFLTTITHFCKAQYLSFDELISLRGKELNDVNDFLIAKKWKIDKTKKAGFFQENYNHVVWAFNKNNYNEKASEWFHYFYFDGSFNMITYSTSNADYYTRITTRIKALNYKLSDKTIEENGVVFTYTNGQYIVAVYNDKDEDGVSSFVFTLRKYGTDQTLTIKSYVYAPSAEEAPAEETPKQQTTYKKGSFTDARDGNVYKTVKIGSQTWMAENLKYLPVVSGSENGSETSSYYYVYDYEGTSVSTAKAT